MNDSVEIRGDRRELLELSKQLKAEGFPADVLSVTFAGVGADGYSLIRTAGDLSAIAVIVHAYFKYRRGRITVELDGKKIEVEGKTTDETLEMLKQGVVHLRKLDDKKPDA